METHVPTCGGCITQLPYYFIPAYLLLLFCINPFQPHLSLMPPFLCMCTVKYHVDSSERVTSYFPLRYTFQRLVQSLYCSTDAHRRFYFENL